MSEDQKQSQLFESVSALVDNQASPLELQRILAHTEKSTGVRSRWHRYNLLRAVMRGEGRGLMTADISEKVRSAIADLEIDFNSNSSDSDSKTTLPAAKNVYKQPSWFAPFGRVAIAASVALVVVLGAQQIPYSQQPDLDVADTNALPSNSTYQTALSSSSTNLSRLNIQNVSSASFTTPVDNGRSSSAYDMQVQRRQQWEEEQVRQAINRLMLKHAQQSSLNQSVGLMPFIRVSDSAFVMEASQ